MKYFFKSLIFTVLLLLTLGANVSARNDEERSEKNLMTSTGEKAPFGEKGKKEIAEEALKKTQDEDKPGKNISENSLSGSNVEIKETEKKKIETRLKKDINSYIIESYKAQGSKIIKDLSIKLSKTIPDLEERKLAYEKIQESLKSRLEKIEDLDGSESKKEILQEFLRHLIFLLDKKIDEITH